MKILSINISLPRKIIFNNKELLTSIYKEPVNSHVKVNKMGIEGDGQADLNAHGGINKSIYAYSYAHYNYWGKLLNKDFINDFGLIGENLTIDDFPYCHSNLIDCAGCCFGSQTNNFGEGGIGSCTYNDQDYNLI